MSEPDDGDLRPAVIRIEVDGEALVSLFALGEMWLAYHRSEMIRKPNTTGNASTARLAGVLARLREPVEAMKTLGAIEEAW